MLEQARCADKNGYESVAAASGAEALRLAESELFDLVITDMAMPNMPGDVLAVEITKIRSDIKILLCTGFSENLTPEKAAQIGINKILIKYSTLTFLCTLELLNLPLNLPLVKICFI